MGGRRAYGSEDVTLFLKTIALNWPSAAQLSAAPWLNLSVIFEY
jgi:hypothetical protein